MPRPSPQPAALALVIAHLISQLRIAKGRQAVRRNKLPLPRRKPFRIPSPSIVPLVRHPARLVNPRRKHPLQVSFRGNQRLSQINHFPLLSSRSDQRPVSAHILPRDPSRLPVARPQQLPLSLVLHKFHRISILLFFLALIRRIRKLLSLSLPRLTTLRPAAPRRHHHEQQHKRSIGFTPCPPCPPW